VAPVGHTSLRLSCVHTTLAAHRGKAPQLPRTRRKQDTGFRRERLSIGCEDDLVGRDHRQVVDSGPVLGVEHNVIIQEARCHLSLQGLDRISHPENDSGAPYALGVLHRNAETRVDPRSGRPNLHFQIAVIGKRTTLPTCKWHERTYLPHSAGVGVHSRHFSTLPPEQEPGPQSEGSRRSADYAPSAPLLKSLVTKEDETLCSKQLVEAVGTPGLY